MYLGEGENIWNLNNKNYFIFPESRKMTSPSEANYGISKYWTESNTNFTDYSGVTYSTGGDVQLG